MGMGGVDHPDTRRRFRCFDFGFRFHFNIWPTGIAKRACSTGRRARATTSNHSARGTVID